MDELIEARRKAREEAALERRRKIKSDVYIHDSDEASDEEADKLFFGKEEERRKKHAEDVQEALRHGVPDGVGTKKAGKKRKSEGLVNGQKKRRSDAVDDDDGDDDDIALFEGYSSASRRNQTDLSSDKAGSGTEDTPLSSQDEIAAAAGTKSDDVSLPRDELLESSKTSAANADTEMQEDESEDSEAGQVVVPTRRRARAGFIIDSDSE